MRCLPLRSDGRLSRHWRYGRYASPGASRPVDPPQQPHAVFGISDNTHVHLALSAAGVVSYYGCQFVPGLACDNRLPAYTTRYFEKTLFETSIGEVTPATRWTDDPFDIEDNPVRKWESNPGWGWRFLANEVVTGALWGGCLTVLEHVLAIDQFEPAPTHDGEYVLAIEMSGLVPEPYSVKAVLRCLGERGLLDDVAAVVVGRPKTSGPHRDPVRHQYRQGQRGAILGAVREYVSEPNVLFDLDFGHTDPQIPIPIGGHVRLDPETQSVCFRSGDELTTRFRSE